jgi:hypothetical protein
VLCELTSNFALFILCHVVRLWLQALPLRSGLVQPSTAAARQAGGSDPFKTLQRVVVQSGRVARPGAKGQREEWAVKFEGINNREQVCTYMPVGDDHVIL